MDMPVGASAVVGAEGKVRFKPERKRAFEVGTVAVPERVKIVLAMLKKAAQRGVECPSNAVLATAIGATSTSVAVNAVAFLEAAGVISVVRSKARRIVTITETGKSTAGTIQNPIDHSVYRGSRTSKPRSSQAFWTPDRDASLMQRIADGADFDKAATVCGCHPEQAAARFDEIAAAMGWQAA